MLAGQQVRIGGPFVGRGAHVRATPAMSTRHRFRGEGQHASSAALVAPTVRGALGCGATGMPQAPRRPAITCAWESCFMHAIGQVATANCTVAEHAAAKSHEALGEHKYTRA